MSNISRSGRQRRLRRGRDWHAWAYYEPGKHGLGMCHWAEVDRPKHDSPSDEGKWVKVRFVRVRG